MDDYKIVWSDKLKIGDKLIDEQHQALIKLISQLPEKETDYDIDVLDEVLEYTAQHFSDEEIFMKKIGYPDYMVHQRIHKKLKRILDSYKNDVDEGITDLYSFKQFMYQWVRDHIMDEDMLIGEYIKSKGIYLNRYFALN